MYGLSASTIFVFRSFGLPLFLMIPSIAKSVESYYKQTTTASERNNIITLIYYFQFNISSKIVWSEVYKTLFNIENHKTNVCTDILCLLTVLGSDHDVQDILSSTF